MTCTERLSVRERVAAHRERLRAAGRIYVNTDLPADLIAQVDQIKEERGAPSRAPIIEEAVRLLIEKQQGA
jgi:metal-responsive CopG/Arc/MetJ family transcriptional regulator